MGGKHFVVISYGCSHCVLLTQLGGLEGETYMLMYICAHIYTNLCLLFLPHPTPTLIHLYDNPGKEKTGVLHLSLKETGTRMHMPADFSPGPQVKSLVQHYGNVYGNVLWARMQSAPLSPASVPLLQGLPAPPTHNILVCVCVPFWCLLAIGCRL